jgi:diguanylate cyclase (GGDEF)-like protein
MAKTMHNRETHRRDLAEIHPDRFHPEQRIHLQTPHDLHHKKAFETIDQVVEKLSRELRTSKEKIIEIIKEVGLKETLGASFITLKREAIIEMNTGLELERFWKKGIENLILDSNKQKRESAMVFIDLNSLKRANDYFGYICGDQLIIALGKAIKEHLIRKPEGNQPLMLGCRKNTEGDEFILFFNKDLNHIQDREKRIEIMEEEIEKYMENLLNSFKSNWAHIKEGLSKVILENAKESIEGLKIKAQELEKFKKGKNEKIIKKINKRLRLIEFTLKEKKDQIEKIQTEGIKINAMFAFGVQNTRELHKKPINAEEAYELLLEGSADVMHGNKDQIKIDEIAKNRNISIEEAEEAYYKEKIQHIEGR